MERDLEFKKLPPIAHGALPVVGHLFKFKSDTYAFLGEHCKTMGPVFSFKLLSRNFYALNHPDFIRHVLVTNAKNYSRKTSYHFLEEMLGQGLLTTEGEEWRKKRRIAQPAFYKDQLAALMHQMELSIDQFMVNWENKGVNRIDLDTEMNHLALSILSSSIIQSDLEQQVPLVKQNLSNALKHLSNKRFRAIKWMNYLPGKTKSDGEKGIASLKNIVTEIIESRRKSKQEHADLLSMLMASTDEETGEKLNNKELLDEVMTMFVAGHDTTSVVLTWAFILIAQHPEIEGKIVQEIKSNFIGEFLSMNELRNFPYTKMVIQEVMRLYPPVWSFGRKALADDEINGFHVPANTFCTMPSIFVHRHPDFWEKPNEFYPEHFLPEAVKSRDKYAYFPFSGGQHLCIGEHYALMEIQLVLIRVLKKYSVKLVSDKAIEMDLLITLKPKNTVYANLEKRI